jgi:hypothetical protein
VGAELEFNINHIRLMLGSTTTTTFTFILASSSSPLCLLLFASLPPPLCLFVASSPPLLDRTSTRIPHTRPSPLQRDVGCFHAARRRDIRGEKGGGTRDMGGPCGASPLFLSSQHQYSQVGTPLQPRHSHAKSSPSSHQQNRPARYNDLDQPRAQRGQRGTQHRVSNHTKADGNPTPSRRTTRGQWQPDAAMSKDTNAKATHLPVPNDTNAKETQRLHVERHEAREPNVTTSNDMEAKGRHHRHVERRGGIATAVSNDTVANGAHHRLSKHTRAEDAPRRHVKRHGGEAVQLRHVERHAG